MNPIETNVDIENEFISYAFLSVVCVLAVGLVLVILKVMV